MENDIDTAYKRLTNIDTTTESMISTLHHPTTFEVREDGIYVISEYYTYASQTNITYNSKKLISKEAFVEAYNKYILGK